MSNRTRSRGSRRCGVALVVGLATLAAPAAVQAAEVNLGTANPYSVLGGSAVTNTGPSVLGGELGVWQPGGTGALSGFVLAGGGAGIVTGGPGDIHDNDANAQSAQSDLTTAYNVAAGEASSANLSSQNVGNRTLLAGTYTYDTSAQLTGALTLDAQGDPNARFLFQIGSTLTTAPNSSVLMINGANPCNVYWQIGSAATLDTDTDFVGTIMAQQSISVLNNANINGRALAQVGAVTLDDNTFFDGGCAAGATTTQGTPRTPATTSPTPTPTGTVPGAGNTAGTGNQPPPASRTTRRLRRGTSTLRRTSPKPGATCTDGFTARVRGSYVKSVVFRLDGKRITTRRRSPFSAYVKAAGQGKHKVTAKVSYKDATRAKTMTLRYRGCAAAALQPRRGPSQFTG